MFSERKWSKQKFVRRNKRARSFDWNKDARLFKTAVQKSIFQSYLFAGYKGWGCTDESEAVSEIDLLAATLLLCLSNLLYLPAVGLAIYRGFYTESFVYFANMIASTVCTIISIDIFILPHKMILFVHNFQTKSRLLNSSKG